MIRHLSTLGHAVTVCSLVRSGAEASEGRGITPHCTAFEMAQVGVPVQALRMVARLPLSTPSSMGLFYSPDLARRVNELLRTQK